MRDPIRTPLMTGLVACAMVFATSGCKLKLNNPGRLLAGDGQASVFPPVTPNNPVAPVATMTTPGLALSNGGTTLQAAGVVVLTTLGETTASVQQTAPGVRHQTGVIAVLR